MREKGAGEERDFSQERDSIGASALSSAFSPCLVTVLWECACRGIGCQSERSSCIQTRAAAALPIPHSSLLITHSFFLCHPSFSLLPPSSFPSSLCLGEGLAIDGGDIIECDEVVWCTQAAAAGWLKGIEGLDLDKHGFIKVDEHMQTSVKGTCVKKQQIRFEIKIVE